MKYLFLFVVILHFQCKSTKRYSDIDKLEVSKNYVFCSCIKSVYKQFGISLTDSHNNVVVDGSIEVYFINNDLSVDIDSTREFVQMYLDSLNKNNSFRSYNDNSLAIAKCLQLYNSKEIEIFIKNK